MTLTELFDPALGWQITVTLLHVGWAGLLIGALAATGNWWLRAAPSKHRYGMNFVAMLALGLSLPATFLAVRLTAPRAADAPVAIVFQAPDPEPFGTIPIVESREHTDLLLSPALPEEELGHASLWHGVRASAPYIAALYVFGVLTMLAKLIVAVHGGQRLRVSCRPVTDTRLLDIVARQSQRLALRLTPAVGCCERIVVPVVLGAVRPILLLPAAMLTELNAEQLAAVLTHELAHIRRHDHVLILVQRVIEAALFFHPAVWYLGRCVQQERENCCDDLVLAAGGDPLGYAESLLRVAELRLANGKQQKQLVALASDGHQPSRLRRRIARLLGEADEPAVRLTRPGLIAGALLIVLASAGVSLSLFRDEETPTDRNERTIKRDNFVAELPGGLAVELIGVSFHPSEAREWWKPDGSPLKKRPHTKCGGSVSSPQQNDCREFAVQIRSLPREHAVTTQFEQGNTAGVSTWRPEDLRYDEHKAVGPFRDPKTTKIRIGLSLEPFGPAQGISSDGKKLDSVSMPRDLKTLYEAIEPLRTEERAGRTLLVFKPQSVEQLADFQMIARDVAGKEHGRAFSEGRDGVMAYAYDLPLHRIARFEYKLRPFRQWVTFENVSLQPGQQTNLEVRTESALRPGEGKAKDQTRKRQEDDERGFPAVKELTLTNKNANHQGLVFINLASGKLFQPTGDVKVNAKDGYFVALDDGLKKWIEQNGIDAAIHLRADGFSLMGLAMQRHGIPIKDATRLWADITPDTAGKPFRQLDAQGRMSGAIPFSFAQSGYKTDEGTYFLFRTREGSIGIMHCQPIAGDSPGVRLRYKLATKAAVRVAIDRAAATRQGADKAPKPTDDSEKLQGVWKVVIHDTLGRPASKGFLAREYQWGFVKNSVTMKDKSGVGRKGTFRIDPQKDPKTLDITLEPGLRPGPKAPVPEKEILSCIYTLDGDTLKFCYGYPHQDRPTAFESKANPGTGLVVLKRQTEPASEAGSNASVLADTAPTQAKALPQRAHFFNDKYSALGVMSGDSVNFVLIYTGFISSGMQDWVSGSGGAEEKKWGFDGAVHLVDVEKTRASRKGNVDKRKISVKFTSAAPDTLFLDGKAYDLKGRTRTNSKGARGVLGRVFILRDEGEPLQTDRTLALRNKKDLEIIGDFAERYRRFTEAAEQKRAVAEIEKLGGKVKADTNSPTKTLGKEDKKLMQGLWKAVKVEAEGKHTAQELSNTQRWLITENKLVIHYDDGSTHEISFQIDSTKTPKAIDLTCMTPPFKGTTFHGIYQLDGDQLKVCYSKALGSRPRDFQLGEDARGTIRFVLERDTITKSQP